MAQKLTKNDRVSNEQRRISKLTNDHSAHFKLIFSHQLEAGYQFKSLYRGKGSNLKPNDQAIIFRSLGKFMDDCVRLSITDVEEKYGRNDDKSDGTFDPETESKVQVQHLCLYPDDSKPHRLTVSVRLHGYFRSAGGYFVVTRLDWFHKVHAK